MSVARLCCLAILAFMLSVPAAQASPEARRLLAPPWRPGEAPDVLPIAIEQAREGSRTDTVWFGGDDGTGVAVLDERWDFETPGSNGFQGWRSHDLTENPGDYFARVTEVDFLIHGDPCVPIQPGNTGMLWCGIHEDEANLRDFVDGMGYQNMMCQRARSPEWSIDPAADDLELAFLYFNNTEPGFDYTYVELICRDGAGEILEAYPVVTFDDVLGDPAALAQFGGAPGQIPAGTLDPATATIQLELRMESEGAWSDQDGLYPTPCGPFGLDDLTLTIGTSPYSFDFEDGAQGWTFERCEGVGAFMALYDEALWSEWVDELGLGCGCTLFGTVVGLIDSGSSPYDPPGLAPGQKEEAESGVVPREGYGLPEWNTAVVEWDAFVNFENATGAHYRPGWKIFPYTTEHNPTPHWSTRHGQEVWYYTSSPYCALNRLNLSTMDDEPLPAEWDSLRFVYEVYCSCEAFNTPPSICVEGDTKGAPLLDNARVGLTRLPDAPQISLVDGGLFMDGYGQNYPTYLEPSDRGNANISYDLSMNSVEENDWHGDSSVVNGPLVLSEASRWLAQLCFRIPRLGARQSMVPEYHTWKARLAADPEVEWVCVLMDSLETNNHTQIWNRKFATYFHENDPGHDFGQPDFRTAQEILPDGVFVPGTRIEYYYRSFWYNGGAPPEEYYVLDRPQEFEILPTMTLVSGEDYNVQWPCILYVDAYNRGAQEYIDTLLETLNYSYDRFDYLDTSS